MSFPYKRILCPVDFDDTSAAAMEQASALARAAGGSVILFHAIFINPLATEGFMLADLQESQSHDALDKLTELAQTQLLGVNHEMEVEIGEAGDCILSAINRLRADLVVMTTHGRRGMSRLLLGSVTERIVRLSPVPVLTVHPLSPHPA